MALLTVVRVGSVFAGFLTSVLGARLIGEAGLGVVGAATTIATIGALVSSGGLNIAAVYHLGQRPAEARRIVGWVATQALVVVGVAAVLVAAMGLLIGTAVLGSRSPDLLAAMAFLAAGLVGFELSGGILLGIHERGAYVWIQLVEALGSLVLTAIILVWLSRDATGYLAAAALGYWLGIGLALWQAWRKLGGFRLAVSRRFTVDALAMGLRGQAGNILQFLNLRLDLLLVPALLNLAQAGIYLIAVRVSEVVAQLATSSAAFLFPQVASQADLRATGTTERTIRLTTLIVVATALPLALLAEPLLLFAFGPGFTSGAWTVRVTLLAMVPLSLFRVLAGDLKGRGRPGLVSLASLLAVGATVVLDLGLIPLLGIIGAAFASLITYSVSAAALLVIYRQVTGGSALALVPRPSDVRVAMDLARRGVARGIRGGSR